MPLRLLRTFALAWFVLLFCIPSCGGDPPADADPCRLERCEPEGATETVTMNGKTFTRAYDAAARKFTSTTPEGRETECGRAHTPMLIQNGRAVLIL